MASSRAKPTSEGLNLFVFVPCSQIVFLSHQNFKGWCIMASSRAKPTSHIRTERSDDNTRKKPCSVLQPRAHHCWSSLWSSSLVAAGALSPDFKDTFLWCLKSVPVHLVSSFSFFFLFCRMLEKITINYSSEPLWNSLSIPPSPSIAIHSSADWMHPRQDFCTLSSFSAPWFGFHLLFNSLPPFPPFPSFPPFLLLTLGES